MIGCLLRDTISQGGPSYPIFEKNATNHKNTEFVGISINLPFFHLL